MPTDNYKVHLDRMVDLSGTFASGITTWTLPFTDESLDTIIPLNNLNDAYEGVAVSVTSNNGTTVTKTGNYSGVACTIGRRYQCSMRLTKPLVVGDNNTTLLAPRFLVRMINIYYRIAGTFDVTIGSAINDATRTLPENILTNLGLKTNGIFSARLPGNPDTKYWTIRSYNGKPLVVTGFEWIGDYGEVCR